MATRDSLSGFRLVSLDAVDSTNDEARRLAARGAADGTLVRALRQTAGRGRLRRTWISEPGNLYFSLILRPSCSPAEAPRFGFLAANAVAEALVGILPVGAAVGCKWPNDVLVAGRKVSGILLESEPRADGGLDWLVVGVGVNVLHHPAAGDVRYPATSVRACGGTDVTADDVLAAFCRAFRAGRAAWERDGFGVVRELWLSRAVGLGEPIRIDAGGGSLEGVFDGIDTDGALIVRRNDGGCVRVAAGDVDFAGTG